MKPNRYMVFMTMGFELVGVILGGIFLGQILDEKYGTKGLILIAFVMLGMAGWIMHLIFLLKRIEKLEARDEKKLRDQGKFVP